MSRYKVYPTRAEAMQAAEREKRDKALDRLLGRRSAEVSAAVALRRTQRVRARTAEVRATYTRLVRDGLPHERIDVAEALDPPLTDRTIRRLTVEVRDLFGVDLAWPPGQSWTLP